MIICLWQFFWQTSTGIAPRNGWFPFGFPPIQGKVKFQIHQVPDLKFQVVSFSSGHPAKESRRSNCFGVRQGVCCAALAALAALGTRAGILGQTSWATSKEPKGSPNAQAERIRNENWVLGPRSWGVPCSSFPILGESCLCW